VASSPPSKPNSVESVYQPLRHTDCAQIRPSKRDKFINLLVIQDAVLREVLGGQWGANHVTDHPWRLVVEEGLIGGSPHAPGADQLHFKHQRIELDLNRLNRRHMV
jgi:hypothetical protein